MSGIDAGPHVADAPLSLKDGAVHGQDHTAGAGRLHNPQICQLPTGQNGILKALQGVTGPGGHANGALGGVRQDMGGRGGNVKPLEHPLDSGKILGIFLRSGQQLRVIRIQKQVPDLAAQGKSRHIFLRGEHIFVNDRGSGLHSVCHLVGNVAFDHGSGVGGDHQPKKRHPDQGDNSCYNPNPYGKFFILHESHKNSPQSEKISGLTAYSS